MTDIIRLVNDICKEKNATLLYLARVGSHAFGTATEDSDEDFRGVILPPVENLLGLHGLDQIKISGEDLVLKSLKEFMRLCLQGNPNILDWLFVDPSEWLFMNHIFQWHILKNRKNFLSKALYHRFKGYIYGHLQKMQRGVTRDLGAKRKKDIEEHGYSCKNAMHMIRLGRMACEVLEMGDYNVWRVDADELLAIRRGEWSKERVIGTIEALLSRMDEALEESCLTERPDSEYIENQLLEVIFKTLHFERREK